MIEIIFLGTGSAVPTIRRNHSAIVLKYKAETILFDCGEGTQRQFRKAKLNPCKLTKLFITHWHGDHVLGIPGLLQTLAMNGYNRKLEVYGPKGTKRFFEIMANLFISQGKIDFQIKEIGSGEVVDTEDFKIIAEEMEHGTPTLAYNFIEKDKLRMDKKKLEKLKLPNGPELKKLSQGKDAVIEGKKIKSKDVTYLQEGKKVSIVLDTKENSRIKKFVKDADLFVCEATYLDEKEIADNYKHLTVVQATAIAKSAKVKKLILTHMSQRFESSHKEFESVSKKNFDNVEIAKDLMKVEL